MSRIGRLPIAVPAGVTVNIKDSQVTVKDRKARSARLLCRVWRSSWKIVN